MKCKKCGQWMVRLDDGTLDCGCPVPVGEQHDYPNLDIGEEDAKLA